MKILPPAFKTTADNANVNGERVFDCHNINDVNRESYESFTIKNGFDSFENVC